MVQQLPEPTSGSDTAPAPEPASLCLDVGAFRHIFDCVFQHADHRALVRLRAVSRECRDRADMRLVRHLVCRGNMVSTSHGRIPSWYTALDLTDWPFGRNISVEAIRTSRWAQLATATRSLDIVEAPTKHSMTLLSNTIIGPLAALRSWLSVVEPKSPSVAIPAYTLVIIAWSRRPISPPQPIREPDIIPTNSLRKVVYAVSRQYWNRPYLLNSLFTTDYPSIGVTMFRPLQVVIIIMPHRAVQNSTRPCVNLYAFLKSVVRLGIKLLDLVKITIVDAHVLPTQLAPLKFIDPFNPYGEVDYEVYAEATFRNLGKAEYYHTQWRWVTLEEYGQEVGPHQLALETGRDIVLPLYGADKQPKSPVCAF